MSSIRDDFIDLIPNFDQRGMDLGLERMQMALKAMGRPCKSIPAIQIVGTNGKGSITSFLQSSLKVVGIKAGITTSPHLLSWCERISIDGGLIRPQEFRQLLISLKPLADNYQLTPFELVMATAFEYFDENGVELLVLEAGLGGRLDATTAHPFRPIIAIANIGLDHCEYLGKDIKDIAKEKAAVISPKSKVISADQHPEVTQILEETIQATHSQIEWVSPLNDDWNLGLNGEIQKQNAAVAKGALEALDVLGWELQEENIRDGLAYAHWPGRLQSASWKGLPIFLDGAHNPSAAEQLSRERMKWQQQESGVQWILGIQKQKDAPTMIRNLLSPYDMAWIVPIPNHDSWSKKELSKACPDLEKKLFQVKEVEEAFRQLQTHTPWPTPPPVIAGSLYLLGDLLAKNTIKTQTS